MKKIYIIPLLIFVAIINIFPEDNDKSKKRRPKKEAVAELVLAEEVNEVVIVKKNSFAPMWENTRTIESPFYKVIIPSSWEKYPNMSNGVEYNYSLSGKGIPANYNGSAVLTSFYISRQAGSSLADAAQLVKVNRAKGARSIKESNKKGPNWEGIMFESDYLQYLNGRDSKRYDLVIFSDKKNAAFLFSFVILVKDSNNSFTKAYNIDDYIEQIYQNIWMNE